MALITISRSSFNNNISVVKSCVGRSSSGDYPEVALVLKDNAYGHGLLEIADLAHGAGVRSVFVKNYYEAVELSGKFNNVTFFYGVPLRVHHNIYPTVHCIDDIYKIESSVGSLFGLGVELKVNIGMNRNGLDLYHIEQCLDLILEKNVRLVGVFGHCAYKDVSSSEFNDQISRFDFVRGIVESFSVKHGIPVPRFHSISSSRMFGSDFIPGDLVRVGMAAYGYDCGASSGLGHGLLPVLKLYAHRISTHVLGGGGRLGYEGLSRVPPGSVVSSYDIGYGDGFFRVGPGKDFVLPNGKVILPASSMDCFSCYGDDDEVCVFDNAEYVAELFGTIPQEVLVRLSPSISRVVVD